MIFFFAGILAVLVGVAALRHSISTRDATFLFVFILIVIAIDKLAAFVGELLEIERDRRGDEKARSRLRGD